MLYTFWRYIKENGTDPVADWMSEIGDDAAAVIQARIAQMESLEQNLWSPKWIKSLTGHEKIFELRIKYNNIQYRPLGAYDKGQKFILLVGAVERGGKLKPRSSLENSKNNLDAYKAGKGTLDEFI